MFRDFHPPSGSKTPPMAQKKLAVGTKEEYNYKEFRNLLKRKHAGTEGKTASPVPADCFQTGGGIV